MRRARSPMARQRPVTFCSIALLLVVAACSPHSSLAAEPAATITQIDKTLQAAEQLLAPAPGPALPLAEVAAESPSAAEFEAPSAPTGAPSTPELPHLAGVSFLGLPPLPSVPLPYKDNSAPAPVSSEASAPAPEQATGESTLKSFLSSFVDTALPPAAKPLAGAAVLGAPLPSASQVLATFTQAIPAEAPAPQAALKVNNPAGKSLVNVAFPTIDTVFSALEKLGRRRLLADGTPALAPGPQPAGGVFPELTNLEVGGNEANPNADTSFADSQWYKTTNGEPVQPQPAAQLQAQPAQPELPMPNPQPQPQADLQAQPQALPQPQPLQNVVLETQDTAIGGLPAASALAPVGAQPGQPQPQPQPLAAQAPLPAQPGPLAPNSAPAPRAFGPIPSEVKVFTEKLVNFLGAEARGSLPKRIDVGVGAGRRRLAQDGPEGALPAEPLAAEAPMSAPGGLAGPSFQALPEPAPLPTLPRPAPLLQMEQPAEAFAAMAPMAAPGSEAQPGSAFQARPEPHHHHMSHLGTNGGRKLQQGPIGLPTPESFMPAVPVETEAYSAEAPMAAPGGMGGPVFQALPEPAPLPPLPRPAPMLQMEQPAESDAFAAMAPMNAPMEAPFPQAQPGAVYQARPAAANHHEQDYFGTLGRRLQQGPPGTVPEEVEATQPDAAMSPMSAPGGLPGPQFQALPEPAPLPPLPRPAPMLQMEQPAEADAFAAMAPMAAPGGEAQPGSALQARPEPHNHHMSYMGTNSGRKLQQGPIGLPTPESFMPAVPAETESYAAQAPMEAPGGLPGPSFQALPEPAPLPPLPRPAPMLQMEQPAESDAFAAMTPMNAPMEAPFPQAQPGSVYQARPAAAHNHEQDYFGTLGRRLQQGPPGTVPEEVVDTEADAAMAPMSAMGAMPLPGPQFQALPEPADQLQMERPIEAPMAAPAGDAQPVVTSLQAKEHVNKPAKLVKTPAAAVNAAGVNPAAAAVTTGRKLMATAPAPAPEEGPAARRDMPPLPPMMPGMTAGAMAPQPGAMPAEGGPQGGPQRQNVGVFQAQDNNNSDSPAINMPKEYEDGLINAFKQAIPTYISNALAAGR